ncbi:MAG: hypothetical protein IPK16_23525 [Anaerolineales bacterium]|nr:hypothetical protein [Anaerolineales bacterium]
MPLHSVGGSGRGRPRTAGAATTADLAGWKASYYANKDLRAYRCRCGMCQRSTSTGDTGHAQCPADFFSARYERTLNLAAGNYLLTLCMDDGARVFIDDQPVMDDWRTGGLREMTQVRTLGGQPRFRVEYFEDSGQAVIYFSVAPFNDVPAPPPGPPAPAPVPDLAIPQDQWRPSISTIPICAGGLPPPATRRAARPRLIRTGQRFACCRCWRRLLVGALRVISTLHPLTMTFLPSLMTGSGPISTIF